MGTRTSRLVSYHRQHVLLYTRCTLVNLSFGTFVVIIGSIRRLLPNVTSGIYRAHTTWAHPDET